MPGRTSFALIVR